MWCAYRSSFYCHSVYFIWAPLITQLIKNPPAMQETRFSFWVGKIPWRRDKLPTPVFWCFPYGLAGEESTCNSGDLASIPGLGRSPREGKGYPLQYSGLENSMDCTVHGVTKSQTQLSNFHFQKGYIHFCVACKLVNDQLNWKLWMYGTQSPNLSRPTQIH